MKNNTQVLAKQGNVVFLTSFGQPKLKQRNYGGWSKATRDAIPYIWQTEAGVKHSRAERAAREAIYAMKHGAER